MLATGTFAIGTEGFMIAPLLPAIAQDLGRSLVAAGQTGCWIHAALRPELSLADRRFVAHGPQ